MSDDVETEEGEYFKRRGRTTVSWGDVRGTRRFLAWYDGELLGGADTFEAAAELVKQHVMSRGQQ